MGRTGVAMLLLALSPALAGYADAVDGLPTHADRETFLWTNAVRIDPSAFQQDYPCDFASFTADEQGSKPLLWHSVGLGAAAAWHSSDMETDGYFSHDSNDGTPWDQRIAGFYGGGWIGENIAWGYDSPYAAVIEGWMCSDGHRANIMNDAWQELGTGVSGVYWTQDFGSGAGPDRAMAMGVHLPEEPVDEVRLAVDLQVSVPVEAIYVVLDGARIDLELALGAETRGLWTVDVPVPEGDCHVYYFVAEVGGHVEKWPETGSYGFGTCAFDDPDAAWLATQEPLPIDPAGDTGTIRESGDGPGDEDPGHGGHPEGPFDGVAVHSPDGQAAGCGCGSRGSAGAFPVAIAALVSRRRRRG